MAQASTSMSTVQTATTGAPSTSSIGSASTSNTSTSSTELSSPTSTPTTISSTTGSNGIESGKDYFYFIVAIAIIVLTIALILGHRIRRKKMMRAAASTRQTALSYDVEIGRHPRNMRGTRRFHGHSRSASGAVTEEREDGLDDSGEAPPPYKRDEVEAERQLRSTRVTDTVAPITIPLRTLSRAGTEVGAKPPDYETTVVEVGSGSSQHASAEASRSGVDRN